MQRHRVYFAAVVLLVVGLFTGPSSTLAVTPRALIAAEARSLFTACGYSLGNSTSNVDNPYLVVGDPGLDPVQDDPPTDGRIVMAIVYRDLQAATRAHQQAHHLAEQVMGTRWDWSDDNGPQLLDGYGGSVWRANVAMVQSDRRTLDSMYSSDLQTGDTKIARPELLRIGFLTSSARYAVDWDFVRCLENGLSSDADQRASTSSAAPGTDAPAGQLTPDFLPGHPW
jgi:hypothetical protein